MSIPKYNIKRDLTPPSRIGVCSVRLRVTSQSRRVDLHTGITLTPKQWNGDRVKQGCVVNGVEYHIINDLLRKQEDFVSSYFNNCAIRGEQVILEELKKRFNYAFRESSEVRSEEFFYIMNSYIESTSQEKSWSARYRDEWERVMNGLRSYRPSTNWACFNEDYMNGYLRFLARTMLNEKIKKNLEKLREFLNWARLKKYPVNEDFFLYKPKLASSKIAVRFLTVDEILHLMRLEVAHSTILEQTRDFFVFQCFVGFRYSDLKRLRKSDIARDGDEYYLEILTKKDKDIVRYKLPKFAVLIYLKYAEYEFDGGVLFPLPSNQKYNEHLKELGAFADIKGVYRNYLCRLGDTEEVFEERRNLESHDARRTFVVTALNEGVDLHTIALLTSHSDLKAMQPYVQLHSKGKDKVIDAIDAAFDGK